MTFDGSRTAGDGDAEAKDAGFTLVELLVVLAIIGLIATLAVPQVLRYLDTAKVRTTQAQLTNITGALELYYLDTGSYPSGEDGLEALVRAPAGTSAWNGPYLKGMELPKDGWGREIRFEPASNGKSGMLISFGKDGQPAGEGLDADLTAPVQ